MLKPHNGPIRNQQRHQESHLTPIPPRGTHNPSIPVVSVCLRPGKLGSGLEQAQTYSTKVFSKAPRTQDVNQLSADTCLHTHTHTHLLTRPPRGSRGGGRWDGDTRGSVPWSGPPGWGEGQQGLRFVNREKSERAYRYEGR